MTDFHYRTRSTEDWDKRANQSGSDYDSYIKDQYRTFTAGRGENCIRILPPSPAWTDARHYGLDVWVHFGIGPDRGSVICLFRQSNQPCPICEERARAERAKDEDLVKELRPTRRVAAFILNRKDEAQGALVWGMPYTVDREISKASKDRSTGEYFFVDHPERGYDVYFDKDGEGLATKYNGVGLARRPSQLPGKILDWLETNPLPEVLHWRTYDEVKRIYEGSGRGENPTDRGNVVALGRGRARSGRDRDRRDERDERDERDDRDRRDERDRREPDDDERRPPPRREPEPQPEPAQAEARRAILERPGARLTRPGAAAPADDLTRAVPRQELARALDDEVPFEGARPTAPARPTAAAPAAASGDSASRAAQLRARFQLDR